MRSRNLAESFRFAFAGFWHALRTQRNIRIHLALAALVILLGVGLGVDAVSLAALTLAVALVIVAELVNTALESLVDLASPQFHPLACTVKDVAAAAVLLASLAAIAVGALVLGPHIIAMLG